MDQKFISMIANELGIREFQVQNTVNLLKEGGTVPHRPIPKGNDGYPGRSPDFEQFATGMNNCLNWRNAEGSNYGSITEQEKMTPELEKQLREATTLSELEDIYLPYRPKRRTRATIARERGLRTLAKIVMAQQSFDPWEKARSFVDPSKEVNTPEDAMSGARDIIAEWVNESKNCRERIRNLYTFISHPFPSC
ncbi:MAG: hypothetical protein IPH45_21355 [Bacteroidales bacterium]|nr:hypothetical protein [Bacteroidales bacterium]